jgi:hypothetical protein
MKHVGREQKVMLIIFCHQLPRASARGQMGSKGKALAKEKEN